MATLGSSGLGMGIVFTLKDQFTGVAKKIQAEQARLKGTTEGLASGVSKSMSKITSAKLLAGGVAVLAPLGAMVNMAAELSDQLANVQKTTGLTDTELGKLRDTVESFDTRTSIADLLEIGTVGGRLGVAKDELNGFIETVDKAVVALGDDFSGGAEQIATELGKIKTLFGDTKNLKFDDALNQIGSALNELGNSGANSAPSVANFTSRLGQLGKLAPTLSQTLGLGATLEELGLRADIAAGGVTNILTVAGQNQATFAKQMGISTDAFKDLINNSPNDMLIQLSKSFAGMDNASTIEALKEMKLGSQEAMKVVLGLSGATDLLVKRQELAAKAMSEGISLQAEFDIKNRTLQAEIDKLTKKFVILAQRIGTTVAPIFMGLAAIVDVLVTVFTSMVKSPIGKFILQLTTAVAIGAVAWGVYSLVLTPIIAKTKQLAASMLLSISPLVVVVGLFAGLVFAVKSGVESFDAFNEQTAKFGSAGILVKIGGLVRGIIAIATSWDNVTETFLLSKGLASKLQSIGILQYVIAIGTWVVRIIEFFKGLAAGVISVFKTVVSVIKFVINLFKPLINLFVYLGSLITKNTTTVKKWASVGYAVGLVIGGILSLMLIKFALVAASLIALGVLWVAQFIVMGITALVAIMPPLLSIIITIGTIVVSVLVMAAIWVAQFIIMGIAALVAMLPVILVVALIGLAIYAVIKIAQWLIDKFHELWGESTGWLDFGKNMVMKIWEGVKSIWGSFTGWLTNAMKNIPGVGQFFEDEEATATLNQNINPATSNPIGESMAIQQGLLSSPVSQPQAGSGVLQGQSRDINLQLDGRTIATVVEDKNKIEQARE